MPTTEDHMMPKSFPLASILSVTTGRLLCPMGDLYEILNYLTGDNLYTHVLPRAREKAWPHIMRQHPGLVEVNVDALDKALATIIDREARAACCREWLAGYVARWGESLALEPMDDWKQRDPVEELVEMRGGDVVLVNV